MMAAKGVLFKLPPICRYTACSPPCFRLPGFGLNEGASPFRLQPAAKTSAWTSCQVDGRKVSPGTFSPGFCVKWEVEHATWHALESPSGRGGGSLKDLPVRLQSDYGP